MSNIEPSSTQESIVFSRKEVDSIDMYVSYDGKITAVSIRGLAKLCGMPHQTVLKLVNLLEDTTASRTVPKSLECIRGKVFVTAPYDVNATGFTETAKLIHSYAASVIILYYAHESKAANDTAKIALGKFVSKGIDTWIKECTGYTQQKPSADKVITMSIDAMRALHEIVGEHIKDAEIIKENVPGIGTILSAYKEETKCLPSSLPEKFLLREFLETKGSTDKSVKAKFAQHLIGIYRGTVTERPQKVKYRGTDYVGTANVYTHDKLPLLEAAWETFCKL